ncbi:MAG TPA: RDD family protein, partial [Gemmatimonadales bacterium]|nr:RDD family protein [Gemmatimonadales bacterium]
RLASLPDGSELISAVDPALRRSVWLHRYPDARPALDPARRNLAREGRLRWVAGRRAPDENWDAYEVPEGRPLLSPELPRVGWDTCRDRLLDLAVELEAAREAGEGIRLGLDRVWIAASDRTILLDFPVGPDAQDADPAGVFLHQVAGQSLGKVCPILPLQARHLLDELPTLQAPDAIVARLRALEDGPVTVTRRKRGLTMALTASPAIVFALFFLVWFEVTEITDPALVSLLPVINYLERPPARHTDSAKAANRRTIGIYLATRYRAVLTDSVHRRGLAAERIEWPVVDSALRQYAGASAEESRLAAYTVDSVWRNQAKGPLRSTRRGPVLAIGAGVIGLMVAGVLALTAALLMRTGVGFRTAGIEIVTKTGRPAGRIRILLRALVVWLPLIVPVLVVSSPAVAYRVGRALGGWSRLRDTGDAGAGAVGLFSLLLLVFAIVSVAVALKNPRRGLADRIAGTHLVPR